MADTSRRRSPARAFLWLLMIPAQLLIDVLLIVLGASIDGRIFSSAEHQGHGVPLFTTILPMLGIIMTVIVVIVSVILVIVRYNAIRKSNE